MKTPQALLSFVEGGAVTGESLQRTREALQAVLDATPAGLVLADTGGRTLLTTAAMEQILGAPFQGEAAPEGDYRMTHLDGLPIPSEQLPLSRALKGQSVDDTELLVTRPDGTQAIVLASAKPLRDAQGAFWGAVSVFKDITARQQEEQALQQTNALLKGIIENTQDLVAAEDLQFRYLAFNRAYQDAFKHCLGADIAIGTSMLDALAHRPEERETARGFWSRAFGGETFRVEQSYHEPNGAQRHYELSFSPILNAEGHVSGAAHIVRDITRHKQLELDLKNADRSKDHFLATLAHELRNPLAPIKSAVEILGHSGTNPQRVAWCRDMIDRQATLLLRLVDDLLDIARIAQGKIQLDSVSLNIIDVVHWALETSRPLIESRRHEISLCLPAEPLHIQGDPIRLAQALSNLLNNAVKYTDEGGQIDLTVERVGSEVLVRVRDSGHGIDPETLPHLFDLYYQVDQVLENAKDGLGIGLALVKRLIELHGGRVEAFSAGRHQGSEFVIRLPGLIDGNEPPK